VPHRTVRDATFDVFRRHVEVLPGLAIRLRQPAAARRTMRRHLEYVRELVDAPNEGET